MKKEEVNLGGAVGSEMEEEVEEITATVRAVKV
jgi:hypothetical protein